MTSSLCNHNIAMAVCYANIMGYELPLLQGNKSCSGGLIRK